jgi:hypothetical protein
MCVSGPAGNHDDNVRWPLRRVDLVIIAYHAGAKWTNNVHNALIPADASTRSVKEQMITHLYCERLGWVLTCEVDFYQATHHVAFLFRRAPCADGRTKVSRLDKSEVVL